MNTPAVAAVGVGVCVVTAGLGRVLLPRMPEPETDTGSDVSDGPAGVDRVDRVDGDVDGDVGGHAGSVFAGLARPAFLVPVAVVAGVAATAAAWIVDGPLLPAWLVLSTVGVLAAGVDAVTTWIPRQLCHLGWVATVAAGVVTVVAAGWTELPAMAFGAGLYTVTLWLVWRFGGGGFGDVRLAPVIGAAAGSLGPVVVVAGLGIGAVLVAVHQLITRLSGRAPGDGVHAFAPGLVAGPYLALTVYLTLTPP